MRCQSAIIQLSKANKGDNTNEQNPFHHRRMLAPPVVGALMTQPISIIQYVQRLEAEVVRVTDTRDTVLDRIERGGYTIRSSEGKAIMRKAGRMAERIARLHTEIHNYNQKG